MVYNAFAELGLTSYDVTLDAVQDKFNTVIAQLEAKKNQLQLSRLGEGLALKDPLDMLAEGAKIDAHVDILDKEIEQYTKAYKYLSSDELIQQHKQAIIN